MENEVWKGIKGYEGLYQVSNLGRVKSLSKNIKGRNYKEIIKVPSYVEIKKYDNDEKIIQILQNTIKNYR